MAMSSVSHQEHILSGALSFEMGVEMGGEMRHAVFISPLHPFSPLFEPPLSC